VQDDWVDGTIDGVYPVECYREAIAKLPADLRMYSSAEEDITRALQAHVARAAQRRPASVRRGLLGATSSSRVGQASPGHSWPAGIPIAGLLALTVGLAVYRLRRLRRSA
jgi:hypothetical protein